MSQVIIHPRVLALLTGMLLFSVPLKAYTEVSFSAHDPAFPGPPLWSMIIPSAKKAARRLVCKGQWFEGGVATMKLQEDEFRELLTLSAQVREDVASGRVSDDIKSSLPAFHYLMRVRDKQYKLWIESPNVCAIPMSGDVKCYRREISPAHQLLLLAASYAEKMRR